MGLRREEWERYRRQATHTLASARRDESGGDHDWASFKAQQAAELGLKGFIRAGQSFVTGHSVLRLLTGMEVDIPPAITECARRLDRVYIPSRYPDVYDAGAPLDYFTASDSSDALGCAERILAWLDDLAAAGSP